MSGRSSVSRETTSTKELVSGMITRMGPNDGQEVITNYNEKYGAIDLSQTEGTLLYRLWFNPGKKLDAMGVYAVRKNIICYKVDFAGQPLVHDPDFESHYPIPKNWFTVAC